MTAALPRDSDGRYSSWAWPGGYPIVYYFSDMAVCCPACANGGNGSLAHESCHDEDGPRCQWQLVGWDIHWEGPPETCAHCGAEIESAYGIPGPQDEGDGETYLRQQRGVLGPPEGPPGSLEPGPGEAWPEK